MGLFLTLEGPEGAGKSSLALFLAQELRSRGYEVVVTREPGGTALGEEIRGILLGTTHSAMLPATEALLNSAARVQHVAEVIRPALDAGQIVICDRFADSTLAYQGAGRGLDVEALVQIQRFATGGLEPDITLLLDVPVEIGQARRRAACGPMNRFDTDSRDFHERIRASFLQAAAGQPDRWRVIDASQARAKVEQEALDLVLTSLDRLARQPGSSA